MAWVLYYPNAAYSATLFGIILFSSNDSFYGARSGGLTFCYGRQKVSLAPACAKACPTESIKFGGLDELKAAANERVEQLKARGMTDAQLYDGIVPNLRG